ncbi:hypothetical protein [Deinococcus sp.]|uniref:hypothetical protein n=1 Tax=Deinococcus sp. TaxID=47478 RepID=UPI003C7D6A24
MLPDVSPSGPLRLLTDDLPRFWAAFGHLDDTETVAAFDELYFQPGTAGLRAFVRLRIESAAALVEHVRSRRDYYASVRAATLALDTSASSFQPAAQRAAQALAALYPGAVFPNITFLIGRMSTGGTTSDAGVLIGTELFVRGPDTPIHELNAWELAVTQPLAILPFIIAHEPVHVQQPDAVSQTLLAQCLRKGAAAYLGEVIPGGVINPDIHVYGRAHEAELWSRFDAGKAGDSWASWLYQGVKAQGEPADLGYFIGAQICRAYLERAVDQRQGVDDLINRAVFDPEGFLQDSQYGLAFRP